MSLDERALRSLITLLDDEDPRSLELVRRRLLETGTAALPFLEEARGRSEPAFAARLEQLAEELRFLDLKGEFLTLAAERVPDLEAGAFLLSRFEHPRIDPAVYGAWLDRVATAAREEIPEDAETPETARRLSAHLFQSMGFSGDGADGCDPDNSCLSRVIDTRRGVPVTLSVLYLLVAKRLGLPVYGVGAPGHFLLGFREEGEPRFMDALRRGRLMHAPEVRRMLVRAGREFRPEHLRPCGPRKILAFMARGQLSIHQKNGAGARAERLSILAKIIASGREPDEGA